MAKWFLKNHDFIHVSSVAGKYNKHKQDGSHLRFPIRTILATVDLQVTSILPITLSQLPFRFKRKSSKQIFKMDAMAAIWDFLSQQFELFFIFKSPRCFLPSFESIGLSVQKKKGKIDFQDGHHLGFLIGTILAILISSSHLDASYQFSNQLALWFRKISEKKSFKMAAILDFQSKQFKLFLDLQVTPMLPTKFQVKWPFSSGEAKNRFSRWLSWRPSWISDRDEI